MFSNLSLSLDPLCRDFYQIKKTGRGACAVNLNELLQKA